MPRAHRIRSATFPYHVTTRANNREWLFTPSDEVWDLCCRYLAVVSRRYELRVWAFVMMTNHLHLLVQTPGANLSEAMNYLFGEVSRAVGRLTGRANHIFGSRFHSSLITTPRYLGLAYRYVYQNPVAARMSERVGEYRYSTMRYVTGQAPAPFPLFDNEAVCAAEIPLDVTARMRWLDASICPKERDLVRRGLRRSQFALSREYKWRSLVERLESAPY